MKRILSVLLALTMLLSLSSVGFANAYINYTYMDEVTGFTYHFGRFDEGATDAGLMVNGFKRSLTGGNYEGTYANAFAQADANSNLFGIGIKPADSYEGTTYTAAPYATVNGVDVVGQEVTYSTEEFDTLSKNVVLNDIAVADVVNGKDIEADNQQYIEISTYGDSGKFSNNTQSMLIKFDLTKIPDDVKNLKNNNYTLTLSGKYLNWSQKINDGTDDDVTAAKARFSDPTVLVFDASGAGDWTEENPYGVIHTDGNPRYYYVDYFGINADNPVLIDKVTFPKSATSFTEFSVNITSQIKKALDNNETYTSILLGLDPTEAREITAEGKVRGRELIAIRPREAQPHKITCSSIDNELSTSIALDGINIDLSKFDSNNEYTHNISYFANMSRALPVISATVSSPAVKIITTQATSENPVATVELTYANKVIDSYKVKFNIESKTPAVATNKDHKLVKELKGLNAMYSTTGWTLKTGAFSAGAVAADKTTGKTPYMTNSVQLMELDLTKLNLEKLDRTKPIFFMSNNYSLGYSRDAIIGIYDANDIYPNGISAVEGVEVVSADELHSKGSNSKYDIYTADSKYIASVKANTQKGDAANNPEYLCWEITDLILECIDAGKTSCVIAFAVDNFTAHTAADKETYGLGYDPLAYPGANFTMKTTQSSYSMAITYALK